MKNENYAAGRHFIHSEYLVNHESVERFAGFRIFHKLPGNCQDALPGAPTIEKMFNI
jgi:hypothetical protein